MGRSHSASRTSSPLPRPPSGSGRENTESDNLLNISTETYITSPSVTRASVLAPINEEALPSSKEKAQVTVKENTLKTSNVTLERNGDKHLKDSASGQSSPLLRPRSAADKENKESDNLMNISSETYITSPSVSKVPVLAPINEEAATAPHSKAVVSKPTVQEMTVKASTDTVVEKKGLAFISFDYVAEDSKTEPTTKTGAVPKRPEVTTSRPGSSRYASTTTSRTGLVTNTILLCFLFALIGGDIVLFCSFQQLHCMYLRHL